MTIYHGLFRIEDQNSHAGCLPAPHRWCSCDADGVKSGGKYGQDIFFYGSLTNLIIDI
jgi:hypothetical protein